MLQCVKTHLRNMVVVPEMIGSIVGVYNGKTYNQVEIKVTSSFSWHPLPKYAGTGSMENLENGVKAIKEKLWKLFLFVVWWTQNKYCKTCIFCEHKIFAISLFE